MTIKSEMPDGQVQPSYDFFHLFPFLENSSLLSHIRSKFLCVSAMEQIIANMRL